MRPDLRVCRGDEYLGAADRYVPVGAGNVSEVVAGYLFLSILLEMPSCLAISDSNALNFGSGRSPEREGEASASVCGAEFSPVFAGAPTSVCSPLCGAERADSVSRSSKMPNFSILFSRFEKNYKEKYRLSRVFDCKKP